jgi:hypothetical protein
MTSFTNRIVEPSVGGSRCAPAAGVVLPKGLSSGQLFPELGGSRRKAAGLDTRLLHTGPRKVQRSFQLAARSFRSTCSGEQSLSLRVSGIPRSSRSRFSVLLARPNLAGASAPAPSLPYLA